MRLEEPIWIWIALAFVGVTFAIHMLWIRRRRFKQLQVSVHVFNTHQPLFFGMHLPILLVLLGVFCLGFALAKPYTFQGPYKQLKRGIDIMVLLDISGSMLIEDFKPNRLEAAKETLAKFSEQLVNDRVGLIVYSGEAFVQYPLSFDHGLLKQFLPFVQSGQLRGGTAIGVALAHGVDRLKVSKSGKRSRAIILLTDGDSNAGSISPEQASQMAKDEDIPVYTLAIGQEGMVPAPVFTRDFFGRKSKQYQMVSSTINHDLLKNISQTTDGEYFHVNDDKVLSGVFSEIQQLEKAKLPEIQPSQKRKYQDQPFLWAAMFLLLISILFEKLWVRAIP